MDPSAPSIMFHQSMWIRCNTSPPGRKYYPALSWHQRYKYLGCPVGAESSHDLTAIRGSLPRDCEKVMTSQLAEWQRLDAFRRFLFPRLTYVLKVYFPGSSWCRKLDTSLRKWVKKGASILSRSCSAFAYTPAGSWGIRSALL